MQDHFLLTLSGNGILYLENYKAVLDYKEQQIVIQTGTEVIKILGDHFLIDYLTNDRIMIKGRFFSFEFCEV